MCEVARYQQIIEQRYNEIFDYGIIIFKILKEQKSY